MVDSLSSKSLDDLRLLCHKQGLNFTGAKGSLIERLSKASESYKNPKEFPKEMSKGTSKGVSKEMSKAMSKEMSEDNYYYRLPAFILRDIAQRREVDTGPNAATILFELDKILPDWINKIRASLSKIHKLSKLEIMTYGAIRGIDYTNTNTLRDLSTHDIIEYTLGYLKFHFEKDATIKCSERVLKAILKGLYDHDTIDLLDTNTLQVLLKTRDLSKALSETKVDQKRLFECRQRYQKLNQLPWIVQLRLKELYLTDSLSNVALVTIFHPLESILFIANNWPVRMIANSVGMLIPFVKENDRIYLYENIVKYQHVVSRPEGYPRKNLAQLASIKTDREIEEYLRALTDEEIFYALGIFFAYSDRNNLLAKAVKYLRGKNDAALSFFTPINRLFTLNKETILGTSVNSTNVFMVAYGNLYRYHCFELEELLASFHLEPSGAQGASFRCPHKITENFRDEEIDSLTGLLQMYPQGHITRDRNVENDVMFQLLQRIKDIFSFKAEMTAYTLNCRGMIAKFKANETNLIKTTLRCLFEVGMYMRRWKGPGNKFPIKEEETKASFDPEKGTISSIASLLHLMSGMPPQIKTWFEKLRVVEYNHNKFKQMNLPLSSVVVEVANGKECIRIASTLFVGTGSYYLRNLFSENISGFNPGEVDRIS